MTPTPEQRLAVRVAPHKFPVMLQRWAGLLFLHWPVDPALIAARLPSGLYVDTFDGKAWLGLVPFFMERVRPAGLPALPWLSWFHELNVRTYVHDEMGNPGVWFFSLECDQPVAVEIARRGFHLPYQHASMRSTKSSGRIDFSSQRKLPGTACSKFEYASPKITRPAEIGSLNWFLVERYLLFSSRPSGQIFCGQVHHLPYQISPADCSHWSTEPLRLDGFSEPTEAPASMLVAAPVDVKIFSLKPLRSASI